MIARKCDSCKNVITKEEVIHLSKQKYKVNLDDHQKTEIICGDYCEECLENGNAIKDLLDEIKGL